MARFYGSIQGERGEATRLGHHGINGHVRGWATGIRAVAMKHDEENGARDRFYVEVTGGSNGGRRTVDLADVVEIEGGGLAITLGPAFGGITVAFDRDGSLAESLSV